MKNSIPKQYHRGYLPISPSLPLLPFHKTLGQLPFPFLNPEPQHQMMEVGGTDAKSNNKKHFSFSENQVSRYSHLVASKHATIFAGRVSSSHCTANITAIRSQKCSRHRHTAQAGNDRKALPFHTMKTWPLQLIKSCPVVHIGNHPIKTEFYYLCFLLVEMGAVL